MIDKRKRGRPQGSGKNDEPVLMKVARRLVRDASLKPTAAMKRVIGERKDWPESDETLLRRLQEKWKVAGDTYLARARREMEPTRGMTAAEVRATLVQFDGMRLALSPKVKEFQEMMENARRNIAQITASPEMLKAIEGFKAQQEQLRLTLNSPQIKQMIATMEQQKQQWAQIAASIDFDRIARVAAQMPKFSVSPEMLALSKPYYSPSK